MHICTHFRSAGTVEQWSRTVPVRWIAVCALAMASFASAPAAASTLAPDTLVICPAELRAALAPWLAHRQRQGHVIDVVEPAATVVGVRRQIGETFAASLEARLAARPQAHGQPQPTGLRERHSGERTPRFVVLVGDVPIPFLPARVNVHWGSEPEIATDAPYADLDSDGLPDVAIGRLPVNSPRELATVVTKILRYELATGHGAWRRRVNIVAGLGGFGPAADAALEVTTRTLVATGIPPGFDTQMTYASWQSPYCPPPSRFRDYTIARLNQGCLFWVYLGHGQRTYLDDIYVPGRTYPILANTDVRHVRPLQAGVGSSIALLVACYSGAFDVAGSGTEASLAEAMLTSADGPVAVIAASRVTLPYGNAVLCTALMEECFTQRRATVGEMLLHAKRRSCAERPQDVSRKALDMLARLLSPVPTSLEAERREHTLLYNLLGDPLLSIAHGQDVRLDVPTNVRAGETIVVRGTSPVAGACTLELVSKRGRLTFAPPQRERYDESDNAMAEFQDTYRRANDRRYAATTLHVAQGEFVGELHLPTTARGDCYVRVFVSGESSHAIGSAQVMVEPAADQ